MEDNDDCISMYCLCDMIEKHFPNLFECIADKDEMISYLKSMSDSEKGIELFRLCGCGIPEKVTDLYRKALKSLESDKPYCERRFCDNELLEAVVLYNLSDWGMAEHGSSIYGSWLTEKGKTALKVLELEWNNG